MRKMDWKDLMLHKFPDVDYEKEIATIEIPEWLRRLGVGVKKELEWNAKRYFMVGLFLPIAFPTIIEFAKKLGKGGIWGIRRKLVESHFRGNPQHY